MNRKLKMEIQYWVAVALLFALTACNLNYAPSSKQTYSGNAVKTVVAKAIDEEIEYVKPNLDPELQGRIDSGNGKGTGGLTGTEIVDLILAESYGEDYIGFCYAVEESTMSSSADSVMESARNVLPEEKYRELESRVKGIEKTLEDFGEDYVKGLPANQQQDFYKDLKSLVVRSVVLLAAGIVYMTIPDIVLWGKISAATAIAVGAGLVAITIMTIYEKYKFGTSEEDEDLGLAGWVEKLIEVPKADFAITASVEAIAGVLSESPVVKGIAIIVFACTNAFDMIRAMLKKYNFNA